MDGLETFDMSSKEIDGVVKSLQTSFQVHQVGDAAFFATAYHVERLALASHNPGVINSLRMYDRLQVLVEMLLAIEAWRTFVLPTGLIAMLEENSNFLRVTFILHTESTLVTLINAILYEACSRVSEDVTVALMDYCARSMQILGEPVHRNRVVQHQRHIGPAVSVIQNALWNAEFKCCILAATALVRNFCESFDELSLAAQTRLLETRDVLMLLVPLIEEPPWTRKLIDSREQRTWEKFIDNQWTEVKREQLLKLVRTLGEFQCQVTVSDCFLKHSQMSTDSVRRTMLDFPLLSHVQWELSSALWIIFS
jgi:zinc finger MYND domain-containing protein 10